MSINKNIKAAIEAFKKTYLELRENDSKFGFETIEERYFSSFETLLTEFQHIDLISDNEKKEKLILSIVDFLSSEKLWIDKHYEAYAALENANMHPHGNQMPPYVNNLLEDSWNQFGEVLKSLSIDEILIAPVIAKKIKSKEEKIDELYKNIIIPLKDSVKAEKFTCKYDLGNNRKGTVLINDPTIRLIESYRRYVGMYVFLEKKQDAQFQQDVVVQYKHYFNKEQYEAHYEMVLDRNKLRWKVLAAITELFILEGKACCHDLLELINDKSFTESKLEDFIFDGMFNGRKDKDPSKTLPPLKSYFEIDEEVKLLHETDCAGNMIEDRYKIFTYHPDIKYLIIHNI